MGDKLQQMMQKEWFRWGVVPFFLMFASFFFLLIFAYSSKSFIIIQNENRDDFTTWQSGEIKAGQKVSGEFTAMSDFMGIVAVRFKTFGRINKDVLIFRLKEKGDKKWYYENFYKVDQFQPDQLFTFGFPPLQNSKGKKFVIEIESTRGRHQDAVAINPQSPVIAISYQLPMKRFLSNDGLTALLTYKEKIFIFTIEAITSRVQNLIILFLPFTLYLTLMSWRTSKLLETFANIVFTVLLGYIFLIGRLLPGTQQNSMAFIILLLLLVVFSVRKFKVSYTIYYILAIFFIVLMVGILIILRRPDIADRSALFAYLFLIIGTIFGIVDNKKKVKKGSLSIFFNSLWIVKLLLLVSDYFFLRSSIYKKIYTKLQYEINKVS